MKPAAFRYCRPSTREEALAILAEHGDEAKVLAGGQSLGPLLNLRLAMPEIVVDINRLPGTDAVGVAEDGALRVGATARQRRVERSDDVARSWPVVAEALAQVAHPTIRNMGTVCGSLAHADPAAELPAVAVALQAQMHIVSVRGSRVVAADEFFRSYMATALEPDEILIEARFPQPPPDTGAVWLEFAPRHGDFALVGVACTVSADVSSSTVRRVELVYAGVGATPVRADLALCSSTAGSRPTAARFAELAGDVAASLEPSGDDLASAPYKRRLVRHLTTRALCSAAARAGLDV